jgi:hypothetical protein
MELAHERVSGGTGMANPSTLSGAAVGMAALTERIKFSAGQAGEPPQLWRRRREQERPKHAASGDRLDRTEAAQIN